MNSNASPQHSERRDAAENRQRILDAARRLFSQYGVAQVSMNRIATEAGVGPGTLYRRYVSKSELCFALVKDNLATFLADVNDYLAQNAATPPSQRLREVIRLFVDFREKKYHLLAGVEDKSPNHASATNPPSSLFNEIQQIFVTLFEEINGGGRAHSNNVFKADMLISALGSDSYSFQREVRGYAPEDIVDHLCTSLLCSSTSH